MAWFAKFSEMVSSASSAIRFIKTILDVSWSAFSSACRRESISGDCPYADSNNRKTEKKEMLSFIGGYREKGGAASYAYP